LSGQILQRSLFAAVDAIVGAIETSHTHRNVAIQPKYGKIINCGLTILIVSHLSLCRLRITTQLRSGDVDKMAGIFTKRIWKPCICQPKDPKIRKKVGGQTGAKQNSGGSKIHPGPPLESPLIMNTNHSLGMRRFYSPAKDRQLPVMTTLRKMTEKIDQLYAGNIKEICQKFWKANHGLSY